MARYSLNVLLGTMLLVGVACEQPGDRSVDGRDSATAHAASPEAAPTGEKGDEHAAAGHSATEHAAGEGGMALLPIMQGLGSNMVALTHALMTDDHETVEKHAAEIAEHAPISGEELERIRNVLGSDMARFEAVDESVHVASVRLRDAAQARRPDQVVTRLGEVQRGCVSCHTQFRERLLTNRAGR
jgi:hypothetical protein